MGKKFSTFKQFFSLTQNRLTLIHGVRLGFASLPLFFMNSDFTNFGDVSASALASSHAEDGIAEDWRQVGSDLRNALNKELKR